VDDHDAGHAPLKADLLEERARDPDAVGRLVLHVAHGDARACREVGPVERRKEQGKEEEEDAEDLEDAHAAAPDCALGGHGWPPRPFKEPWPP